MPDVYTAGYAGHEPDALRARAVQLDAVVIDIRYAPFSRNPEWKKEALERTLGKRYRWVHAFGNRNYRNDGPIDLVDPKRGLEFVEKILDFDHQSVILLCGCRDLKGCHRANVSALFKRDGYSVAELAW